MFFKGWQIVVVWRTSQWNLCKISLYRKWILSSERAKWHEMSFHEFFQKKNSTLFGKTNLSMLHYSLRVIDELKMSEIRILNVCHKKSILVDIYRQSLLSRHMKGVPLFNVRHSKGGGGEGLFCKKHSLRWSIIGINVHIARMRE